MRWSVRFGAKLLISACVMSFIATAGWLQTLTSPGTFGGAMSDALGVPVVVSCGGV